MVKDAIRKKIPSRKSTLKSGTVTVTTDQGLRVAKDYRTVRKIPGMIELGRKRNLTQL
jgi:hypothetical protein